MSSFFCLQHTSHVGLATQRETGHGHPATPAVLPHDAYPPSSPTNGHHLHGVARRPSRMHGLSREAWIDKLNDARCRWMVMLHRYSSSRSSGGPISKLRQDDTRMTSMSESMAAGRRVVPAADFCPECSSVVEVELECTGEGEFVAEYRGVCSMCVGRQLPQSTNYKPATPPNPWRILAGNNRRCDIDRNWRLEKVKRAECFVSRTVQGGRLSRLITMQPVTPTQTSEIRDVHCTMYRRAAHSACVACALS